MYHEYQQTEVSYKSLATFAIVAGLMLYLSWMGNSMSGFWVIAVLGSIVVVGWGTLTIRVENGTLHWYMGPGLWTHSVDLYDIERVEVVHQPKKLRAGSQSIDRGRSYSAGGEKAVELETADRKVIRLGSREPEKLATVLRNG